MRTEPLLGVLQLADGLFPAGAYAHSFGLETLVQDGVVTDATGVRAFLRTLIEGGVGTCDAIAVARAVRAAREPTLETAFALDEEVDALKPASELREASRQMGRQTLRAAARLHQDAAVSRLFAAVETGRTAGHHPLAFGFAAEAAGVAPREAAAAYLYSTAAAVAGASLRLLPLGQLDGQAILASLRPAIARLAERAASAGPDGLHAFTPAIEIAAMRHARLEARLFRS